MVALKAFAAALLSVGANTIPAIIQDDDSGVHHTIRLATAASSIDWVISTIVIPSSLSRRMVFNTCSRRGDRASNLVRQRRCSRAASPGPRR